MFLLMLHALLVYFPIKEKVIPFLMIKIFQA